MRTRKKGMTRRRFTAVGATAWLMTTPLAVGMRSSSADELPRLDESDSTAKALNYVHDATRIEVATRGGQDRICRTCRFYTDAQASWGPCTLFPGKAVNADGWCKGWVATTR